MEINEIFSAQGKSTWHILCEQDIGYYIPAYQREYSWGKDNINRLFEDTAHGLKLLLEKNDSITFIGTIITIHDTKCQTVEPIVKPDMPGKVMLIIDGQQRLVTLCLLFTVFHEQIRIESKKFEQEEDDSYLWLYNKAQELCSALEKTYQIDKVHGEKDENHNYRYYPRIIRSLDDSWSRKKKHAQYSSPVANYLFNYLNHVQTNHNSQYKHIIPEDRQNIVEKHKKLNDNIRIITKTINEIANQKGSDHEMPDETEILNSSIFQEILFQDVIPDGPRKELQDKSDDKRKLSYKRLFRMIVLCKFIMDRMALTVVSAKNEDYAFDMFESLNTTGEPLTAFETFKPKVIQAEGLQTYEDSESRIHMKTIDEYLDVFKNAQQKHKATSGILIPFALAETGSKLSKRLSDQRRYLKEEFDLLKESIEKQRKFIRHLSHTTIFIENSWSHDKAQFPSILGHDSKDIDLELMCLDFLRASGHSITIAPIVRFYSLLRTAAPDERGNALSELKNAIKAITAFSVLWRASRSTTEQIDSHYRKLMESGFPELGIPPLARSPKSSIYQKPTAENLKSALKHILREKGGINDCESWIKKVWKQPIYSNRAITRFICLAGTHDTVPDQDNPGLVKVAKNGKLNMLNTQQWNQENELTIEHIAPQSPQENIKGEWDEKIYEDLDFLDCLGNLTLLPKVENSSIGNKSWEEKRVFYKVLSAGDEDEHNRWLKQAKAKGLEFKASTEQILSQAQYLPHVSAIGTIEGNWTTQIIEQRSKRVAEIAWARISPWLGIQ